MKLDGEPVADFQLLLHTDTFLLIKDMDAGGPSVTNTAAAVLQVLHRTYGPLKARRVYYVDSTGQIDELRHQDGKFTGFGPCSPSQRDFLRKLCS